ncbi:MAG: hypothetical protein ACKVGW_08110 [Verrucomicrobiia bacterium]
MKLIIARFFDTRLKFELGKAVAEIELEMLGWKTNIAGFVVRIWVRALNVFNRPPASGFKVAKFAKH